MCKKRNGFIKGLLLFLLCGWASLVQAAVFTSSDGNFTMDLPAGWKKAEKPATGAVLSIVKNTARIDIKNFPQCNTEACIEQKTQADLLDIKKRISLLTTV